MSQAPFFTKAASNTGLVGISASTLTTRQGKRWQVFKAMACLRRRQKRSTTFYHDGSPEGRASALAAAQAWRAKQLAERARWDAQCAQRRAAR